MNINLDLFIKKLKERGVDNKLKHYGIHFRNIFLYKEIPYKGSDVHKKNIMAKY
jgi:hypothetical protein